MAGFNAEKLGERLDELNREKLAAIEKLSDELLAEMRRKGPMRAGPEKGGVSAGADPGKRKGSQHARR